MLQGLIIIKYYEWFLKEWSTLTLPACLEGRKENYEIPYELGRKQALAKWTYDC
jgi:hypothetical protein